MLETLETIGTIHTEDYPRDAVHVAVIQMHAKGRMRPGASIDSDGDICSVGRGIGVVDPFLKAEVQAGQRFWVFMTPGSITGLRHAWAHPALPTVAEKVPGDTPEVTEAKKWLKNLAERENLTYDFMVKSARACRQFTAEGYDCHINADDEFWRNMELVTGEKFDEEHRENTYFSCSC